MLVSSGRESRVDEVTDDNNWEDTVREVAIGLMSSNLIEDVIKDI